MAQIELRMPKMGESVAEATIIRWLKSEGDAVAADEAVLEIATDKVDSEIPSPAAGILAKRLFKEGDVIKVGSTIALLSTETYAPAEGVSPEPAQEKSPVSRHEKMPETVKSTGDRIHKISSSGKFYSPLVRNIASREGVSLDELENLPGSGKDGRLTKQDILAYIPSRRTDKIQTKISPPADHAPVASNGSAGIKTTMAPGPGDEIIEMDRMRRLIADHMVMSKHTSPHVTSFVEADVSNIVAWREKMKNEFEQREKEKLTFTPIFIEAVVKAIRDFPMINISVDGSRIIIHKNINIGMATALPSGNLIVPVIRNADRLNLTGLTKAVNDLAARARGSKLQPDEIQGGTYTVTNVGTFGNVMGTPIINQPQVAILAMGAIKKKPVVIESPEGDSIGIRHMMFLSHSYDHRVVDGALGGSFVRRVADYLEKFDINRSMY